MAAYNSLTGISVIPVLNKTDLPAINAKNDLPWPPDIPPVKVSALTGNGIEALEKTLSEAGARLLRSSGHSTACGLNQRGVLLVETAYQKLLGILNGFKSGIVPDPEILSLELTSALKDLREITGEGIDDLALDRIFERFCVGK